MREITQQSPHRGTLSNFADELEKVPTSSNGPKIIGEPEGYRFRIKDQDVGLVLVHYQGPQGLKTCCDIARELTGDGPPLILVSSIGEKVDDLLWLPAEVRIAADKVGVATFDPFYDFSNKEVFSLVEKAIKTPLPRGQLIYNCAVALANDTQPCNWDLLGLYQTIVSGVQFEVDRNNLLSRIRDFYVDPADIDELRRVNRIVISTVREISEEQGRRVNLGISDDVALVLRRLAQKDIYLSQEDFLIHMLPAVTDVSLLRGNFLDVHRVIVRMSSTLGEDVASLADKFLAAAKLPEWQRESEASITEKLSDACWTATKDAVAKKIQNATGPVLIVAPGYLQHQMLSYLRGEN